MKKILLKSLLALLVFVILYSWTASALLIKDINVATLYPGLSSEVRIIVDNDADMDVEDVTFSLDLSNTPLTTIGSSEDSLNEIEEDEEGLFIFILKANNEAKPGSYNIPYVLTYRSASQPKRGTFGIIIKGHTDLEFSVSLREPIIGSKGNIDFKIVNKGTGDARFVNLKILPEGYTLLSEEKTYIGTVSADDFESVSMDVVFNKKSAKMYGVVEYVDFDNNKIVKNIEIPLTIYTQQEAIEKGIAKKNNTLFYAGIIAALIIIWIIWRAIARKMRKRRSMQREHSI